MFLPLLVQTLGLDKAKIAQAAGIDPATLSRISHGRQAAPPETLRRIEVAVLGEISKSGTS